VEPSEEQYLIINALDTLELLGYNFYDGNTGVWYIETPSPMLPISKIFQNGDISPISPSDI